MICKIQSKVASVFLLLALSSCSTMYVESEDTNDCAFCDENSQKQELLYAVTGETKSELESQAVEMKNVLTSALEEMPGIRLDSISLETSYLTRTEGAEEVCGVFVDLKIGGLPNFQELLIAGGSLHIEKNEAGATLLTIDSGLDLLNNQGEVVAQNRTVFATVRNTGVLYSVLGLGHTSVAEGTEIYAVDLNGSRLDGAEAGTDSLVLFSRFAGKEENIVATGEEAESEFLNQIRSLDQAR